MDTKSKKSSLSLALFEGKKIRRHWNEKEEKWFFSVIDVVEVLSGSNRPRKYWDDLKRKLKEEGSQLSEKIGQLKMQSSDGKLYLTDVADTETMFRLIQSIPSPNAEPFKLWLARVGYERVEETQDPELAIKRALRTYRKQGRGDNWINLRLKSIEVRKDLTDEWEKGGVKGSGFAVLTDEITNAWAGLTTREYKKLKSLKKENLKDSMTNLELILNMLAEESTTEISKVEKPDTFDGHKQVARKGGGVAGTARKKLEKETGRKVISKSNFLHKQLRG